MAQYVVIGTSPMHDTSVACGPYRTIDRALQADGEMIQRGWNAEMVPLEQPDELPVQNWTDGE